MRVFFLLALLISFMYGETTLKIATYNIENLFDLQRNGHEYKEYIPNAKSNWNDKNYRKKLKNIAKVIKDINPDIIGLQEIESLQALKDLRYTLKREGVYYRYYKIANLKSTTIKVAILSKIPFVYTHEIAVTSSYRYRNILEVKFKINNEDLYILINHWKSKAGPESMRIVSAKKLRKRIEELGKNKNIIALGDFNSDYEEYEIFKRKRKHNDTDGITGINHILGTIKYQNSSQNIHLAPYDFYNLWYDTELEKRYSYIYRGKKEAMDSILVTAALLDKKGIDYKPHSIAAFEKPYLFKGKAIYRWQTTRSRLRRHKGKGYSDHLPVIAEFVLH
ncbi:endonuclease/exonuclease/phosphatase family protein [Sulfurimonas sp. SWIR-19]|uniref:endonuclease/exonuclease/phosphatase family protein n=1 Tax=Sulfurimonas sp. SWIR-19 TaxID=2878390 RepID=UPI001CF46C24|nr:endonuclease/exonuclease/phosphatase family protein [Sulfurimonas sp. SWIR-19]UCM99656.1 endonuclease/exonuclease/phosphatase family protein [Sulfurimonas sp. SWIR-19]